MNDEFPMSDEDKIAYDETIEEIHAEQREMERKDNETLEKVKSQVSEEYFKNIEYELEESGYYYDFSIVKESVGEHQDYPENDYELFVNQSSGYFGDDWYGTVCVSLPCGDFLLWSFSM